jgi:hypothetical protein
MQRPLLLTGAAAAEEQAKHASIVFDCKIGVAAAPHGALLDSGAERNFISRSFVLKHKLPMQQLANPFPVELANGKIIYCSERVRGMLNLDGWTETGHDLYVIPMSMQYEVILGMPWLAAHRLEVDWKQGVVAVLRPDDTTVVLRSRRHMELLDSAGVNCLMSAAQLDHASKHDEIEQSWLCMVRVAEDGTATPLGATSYAPDKDWNAMNEVERARLMAEAVQRDHADVLRETLPPGLPPERAVQHEIKVLPGSQPPCAAPYKMSEAEYRELHNQLTKLVELGHIRPSSSPYGAPVLFVKKKNGELRLVTDYRALNRVTVKNAYPMPTVDELLDRLAGAKWFTTFDLTSGFNQVRVSEESIPMTAFRTRYGHYEYLVMPFGLVNAPATFQRLANATLESRPGDAEEPRDFVMVYMDDVIIFSKSLEEHERHVRWVLQRLRDAKLYVRPSKCNWFTQRCNFLGHVVSEAGIEVDGRKVEAIVQWSAPRNPKELMSFLGAANYFRRHIRKFSHMAAPLTELLRKDRPWVWGKPQDEAFAALKHALTTAPVLRPPDPSLPYILYTDASDEAVGAVLMQDDGSGPQPVAYLSRKHTSAERNYPTREKELLAIVEALKEWRHYLASSEVAVFTDHDSLRYLLTQKLPLTGRMARWLEATQEFNLSIGYVPGKANVVADALSRMTLSSLRVDHRKMSGRRHVESRVVRVREAVTPALERMHLAAMVTASVDPTLLNDIKKGYRSDPLAQEQMDLLQQGDETALVERQGLLFRQEGEKAPLLYIPGSSNLRQRILAECHDAGLSGHFGRDKTLDRLRKLFWWPTLAADVDEYVQTCPRCMLGNARNTRKPGLLQPLPIPGHAWQHMSLDFVTGLPRTAAGHDAVLTCVCPLTKMVRLIPTDKEVTAERTAQLVYKHVWSLFGTPERLISDRDPRFMADFWQELMRLVGTRLNMSTAYHAETDGQTERVNRVMLDILRHYVSKEQSDWDILLPVVEFAINSAKHRSTGFSPFYLNYGREPVTPAAFLRGAAADLTARTGTKAEDVVQRIATALAKAKECIAKAKQEQAEYANRKRVHLEFERGDWVLLATRNLRRQEEGARKLDYPWDGPLVVTEKVGEVSYRLAVPHNRRITDVFHVSLLKPWKQSDQFGGREEPEHSSYMAGKDEKQWFDVEKLLGERRRGKKLQYNVRWKNYSSSYDTWEPADQLRRDLGAKTLDALVKDYRAAIAAKRRTPQQHPKTATKPTATERPKPTRTSGPSPTRQSARLRQRAAADAQAEALSTPAHP